MLLQDLFKMVKLRHLHSKRGVFQYHPHNHSPDRSSKLESLQTLHSICPCEECRNFLLRTPNLRKLGFYGDLISNDFVLMFPDLEYLEYLETLSFCQRGFLMNRATTLPPVVKFPRTVTWLTLKNTFLKWEELSILQTLPSLEVLKLIEKGCQGPIWNTNELEEGFSQLKCLRLQDLHIEGWNASEDQFPRLEVRKSRRSAEESAREILEERRNTRGDDGCINLLAISNYFKLDDDKSGYPCISHTHRF
ncbi:putative late blight resistance protein homolog R1A-10 [Rhododendron vialii]|uniref:putative late blight resistance protein homolog R1A-10 n=1 Tax=Rhododendron vialii TaxID=182163 RepID=UPI00265F11FE|nr:putative late blight resistance protein homolog R1A-10 [Rhododendron vialii]